MNRLYSLYRFENAPAILIDKESRHIIDFLKNKYPENSYVYFTLTHGGFPPAIICRGDKNNILKVLNKLNES